MSPARFDVLSLLYDNPEGAYALDAAAALGLTHAAVRQQLHRSKKLGLVRKVGGHLGWWTLTQKGQERIAWLRLQAAGA